MRSILIVVLVAGATGTGLAQAQTRLAPGQRVRVRTVSDAGEVLRGGEGTILRVSAESLSIRSRAGGAVQVFAVAPGAHHQVSRPPRPYLVRGATIGGFSGIIAAGIFTMSRGKECTGQPYVCLERDKPVLARAAGFGAVGAVAGIIIGRFTSHERWSTWPAARPGISFGPHGPGVGISLTF